MNWIFATALALLAASTAFGERYPSRPIRIVTSAVGGSGDIVSRLISQEISGPLGQTVIVDNRSTISAVEIVSKATHDGYTLLESGSTIWLTPLLEDNVSWDPLRDFAPVTQVERSPNILVVHPSLPVTSVGDLIRLAKARPGELNYSSSAPGGSSHLAGELFKLMAGVNVVWVSYKGSAAAALALVAGEVQLAFASSGAVSPLLNSNKLRAIAVTGLRPSPLAPGLPTVSDSGLPGFEVVSIDVILAPAGTPAPIIERLRKEIVPLLNRADIKERLLHVGTEVVTSTPEELAATMRAEMSKWGKVIRKAGIHSISGAR